MYRCLRDTQGNFWSTKRFQVGQKQSQSLRVWLSTDPAETMTGTMTLSSYNEKITLLQNKLHCWEHRRLRLLEKTTILKRLIDFLKARSTCGKSKV